MSKFWQISDGNCGPGNFLISLAVLPASPGSDALSSIALRLSPWPSHFIDFSLISGESEGSRLFRQWRVHDGSQVFRANCLTSRSMLHSIISPPCISSSCQSLRVAWKARNFQDAHAEAIARAKDLKVWSQLCVFIRCILLAWAIADYSTRPIICWSYHGSRPKDGEHLKLNPVRRHF